MVLDNRFLFLNVSFIEIFPFTEVQESGVYFLSTITYSAGTLTQTVVRDGYSDIARLNLRTVRVLGANNTIDTVLVNGEPHIDFEILPSNEIYVHNLQIPVNSRYNITFTTKSSNSGASSLFGCSFILFFVTFLYHVY